MNHLEFTLLVAAGSFVAGLLGSLTGLGGGVVLVPLLTLFFKVDIRYAIGASLVSVIATSSGAAAAYVKEGFSNIRIGMFLEIATTIGALAGAFLAAFISTRALAVIFGVMLLYSAYLSRKPRPRAQRNLPEDSLATRLRMNGDFPSDEGGMRHYNVQHVPTGFSLMFGAGALSGLLGIGSGAARLKMSSMRLRPSNLCSKAGSRWSSKAHSAFAIWNRNISCPCHVMATLKLWRDLCWRGCREFPAWATFLNTKATASPSRKWTATASPKCKLRSCNRQQWVKPAIEPPNLCPYRNEVG